jgi:two-component system NarL family sensor kinase
LLIKRATAIAVISVVLSIAAAILDVVDGSASHTFAAVGEVIFTVVGLVIARQQPRNTVAWTFLVSGLLNSINNLGVGIAAVGLRDNWPSWLQFFGGWCTGWTWFPALFSIITIGLLHFPDGRPVSPRWRWADKAAVATMGLWIISVGVGTWGLPPSELQSNSSPHPHGWHAVIWPFA